MSAETSSVKTDRAASDPDPEAAPVASRRRFSGSYKLGILAEVDACAAPGEVGAILRREGLYSSHLTKWRRQKADGALAGLTPKKRGRKAQPVNPLSRRVAELEKETQRLRRQLEQAETIIAVQKKLSQLLELVPMGNR
jgi:transposase